MFTGNKDRDMMINEGKGRGNLGIGNAGNYSGRESVLRIEYNFRPAVECFKDINGTAYILGSSLNENAVIAVDVKLQGALTID